MQNIQTLAKILAKTQVMFLSFMMLLILSVFISTAYFNHQKSQVAQNRPASDEMVAGAQDQNDNNMPFNLPLMQNANILSVDKSNNETYILLQSDLNDEQIQEFYQKYFRENKWKKEGNQYSKDKLLINLEINNSIIKITIVEK